MPISSFRSSNFYRKILSAGIDSAIEGLTANDSTKLIFSTMQPNGNCCLGDSSTDPVNPVFTRSTTCWAKNIDTSPISPWNNGGGYAYPFEAGGFGGTGTLISPRHILFADHFSIKNGKKLIFVDMNNNCYIRTLSNQSLAVSFTDIKIGLLDSDLPANVSFCKVAGFNLVQKININNKVPVLYTDTSRNALVADYYYAGGFPFGKYGKIDQPLVNSKRRDFYEQVVGGDSGNPVNFVYNNKIILLFTFTTSDLGQTPSYYLDQINSTMTTLGGGYTLSLFNENDIISQEKNISIKKQNLGNGKLVLSPGFNYILNSQFDADNNYPIYDGSQYYDENYNMGGIIQGGGAQILANYYHNSPLFYIPGFPRYYSTFANRTFHSIDSPYDILPIGHAIQPRLMKLFGVGSRLSREDNSDNNYTRTITSTTSFSPIDYESWVKYGVEQIVRIPLGAKRIRYGVKYLVKSDDNLRLNNFGGLSLYFQKGFNRSYVNFSMLTNVYEYASISSFQALYSAYRNIYKNFAANSGSNAMCQWLGPNTSRVKARLRNTVSFVSQLGGHPEYLNNFQILEDTIDIPTFSTSSAEPDLNDGFPEYVSLQMFFAEFLVYLNDDQVSSGSIYFYKPFLYFEY